MNNKHPPVPHPLSGLPERARRHFQSVAILNHLDRAERQATPEQFAAAARIAARAVCNARTGKVFGDKLR
jgi:hypothetical protein